MTKASTEFAVSTCLFLQNIAQTYQVKKSRVTKSIFWLASSAWMIRNRLIHIK